MKTRPARTPPAGRHHHGFAAEEFTAYDDADGRADPAECGHPIFLDHVFPHTGLCLECGHEIVLGEWRLASPDDPLPVGANVYAPEGRVLTDDELATQRHRWHGIWGLDGWSHADPFHPAPPARLKGRYPNGLPDAVAQKGKRTARTTPAPSHFPAIPVEFRTPRHA